MFGLIYLYYMQYISCKTNIIKIIQFKYIFHFLETLKPDNPRFSEFSNIFSTFFRKSTKKLALFFN